MADLLPVLVVCLCSGARLVRVFVYEAYALVLASSLMGVIIGVLVGWTFSQQRSLFTQVGGCGRLHVCVALNLHGLVTTTTAPCFLLGTVAHRGCHHDRVRRVFRAGSSYPRPLLVEDANHRVAPHGGVAPAQSISVCNLGSVTIFSSMHTFAPSQLQRKCGGVASMTSRDWHSRGSCTKCGSTTNYVQGTWTRIRRRPPRWWLYGCPTPCCQCSTASWLQHEQETGVLGGCPPLQRLTVVASLRPRAELQLAKHAGWQHHRLRCLGG